MLIYKKKLIRKKNCISRQIRFLNMFKPQIYSFSAHKESNVDCKCDIKISPLTTLYETFENHSL